VSIVRHIDSTIYGAMHRAHVKVTKDGKQAWSAIPWQHCPACKMMLMD
jgi:hypothetical protein